MSDVGSLLKHWRTVRRQSQLALAAEAAVSVRHLCFLETGRAKPSRGMVLKLAEVLDVPLRERNTLLLSAGFSPEYQESELDAPTLSAVRDALETILAQQEPFPALVMDRSWDIRHTNTAARRFFAFLQDLPREIFPEETGLIIADAYDAHLARPAPEHRLPAPTRKSMMVRFAMAAAQRINRLVDPQGHGEF